MTGANRNVRLKARNKIQGHYMKESFIAFSYRAENCWRLNSEIDSEVTELQCQLNLQPHLVPLVNGRALVRKTLVSYWSGGIWGDDEDPKPNQLTVPPLSSLLTHPPCFSRSIQNPDSAWSRWYNAESGEEKRYAQKELQEFTNLYF